MTRDELKRELRLMREDAGDVVRRYVALHAPHTKPCDISAIIGALGSISLDEAIDAIEKLEREAITTTPVESLFAVERSVRDELIAAIASHGRFASAHEAYSVCLEELDEVWLEVKKKRAARDPVKLYRELTQLAAMAEKWMLEVEKDLPPMYAVAKESTNG